MASIPLIECADDITAPWLHQVLVAGGASDFPLIESIEVEQMSDVISMMGSLFRCRVIPQGGEVTDPASVIIKLPTSNTMYQRLARWTSLYQREYVFYRDILPQSPLRAPVLFYGDWDGRSHRFVLVLEDLGNMESLPQKIGVSVERAQCAIRSIAEFHGRFWEAVDEPALAACSEFSTTKPNLLAQIFYLLALPLAFEHFDDLFTTDRRRQAEAFGVTIGAHFNAVAKGPKTIIHGDYRTDNMLFGGTGENDLAVIDWQCCGIGCGMYDVAYFLATSVSTDDRHRIERDVVAEYHDIICRMGAKNYTRDDCWRSYRQNLLGVLVPVMVVCGHADINNREAQQQAYHVLERVLTAIDDQNSWEFLPTRDGFFPPEGRSRSCLGVATKSIAPYSAYAGERKVDHLCRSSIFR